MLTHKTKILYVITKSNWGGAQRYVYDLATSLPTDQFDVTVLFGEGGVLEKKLREANIRTIKLDSLQRDVNPLLDFATVRELINIFKTEQPDIIHLNSSKIGGLGALAGRIAGIKKIIFTGHAWAFNEERSWLSKKIILFIYWLTILFTHTTIAVAENIKLQISALPFISQKIITIHNGIDPIDFKEGFEARQFLGKHISETTWIGTISELHKNKGLDIAIEVFSHISSDYPEAGFIIIGEGEERKNLEKLIRAKNLTHRIHLLGRIDNACIYLKAFDIFTLTSRTEAFPYVLLEAGQAALAVITSDVGGTREIITDHVSGLLTKPNQKTEVVTALKYILLNPKQREVLGTNLRQKVMNDFGKEKMIKKTIALYSAKVK